MDHPQEQRRKQAVVRYLAGDQIEAIWRDMHCSKSWLYKWKARYQALTQHSCHQPPSDPI